MNIKELQKPLEMSDIDFRVGEVRGSTDAFATILAYKDARVDMNRLDEVTNGLWQNKYERDSKGVLQCGIGIKIGDEWVWKWSCGTPSTFEKEKGEYSDAFKRAGFMWGIGRELYDYPTILVRLEKDEAVKGNDGKWKATYKLKPTEWSWKMENGKLIATQNGKVRVSAEYEHVDDQIVLNQSNVPTQAKAPSAPFITPTGICKKCGAPEAISKTTGKAYCSKKCWLAPAQPVKDTAQQVADQFGGRVVDVMSNPDGRQAEVRLEDVPF